MGQDFYCIMYVYAEAKVDDLVDRTAWEVSGMSLADYLNKTIPRDKGDNKWLPGVVSEDHTTESLCGEHADTDSDGSGDDDNDSDASERDKDDENALVDLPAVGSKRKADTKDGNKREAKKRAKAAEKWNQAFVVIDEMGLDCYKGREDEGLVTADLRKFAQWLNLAYYECYVCAGSR
ncbi:hypothetical protein pmac_cds_450 [Pandoravirus macleodensis]|uniref:Uncharacterized protein n=1 Tax=Pandoravirus macleodensis TaxID=2107707 RepID=A0A2U7UF90_9VIRU|nr:hypothetical protein pmac_cds_450 [Pandoravirus macleodensis]AVK77138.1 hypothetical protein pmac_cds_450 [Pandoravirus macleodensis]